MNFNDIIINQALPPSLSAGEPDTTKAGELKCRDPAFNVAQVQGKRTGLYPGKQRHDDGVRMA